jgi:hypothetical protein
VRLNLRTAAAILLGPVLAPAARLTQPAESAFDTYVASLEMRLASQHGGPGTCLAGLARESALAPGAVRVEAVHGGTWQVSGGLMHHWRAAALVPGANPQDLLTLLRDYSHLDRYYAPQVVSSHALSDDGKRAMLAMRFNEHRVVTVVLDAEFETQSGLDGAERGYSYSRSTHIWQIDQPGSAREHRRTEGADDGFFWRLNSYWSFEQRPEGLLMECEAVSLTRDVPAGLGWLIMPVIETLPRASLEFTLTATKNALAANATRRHSDAN